MNYPEAYIDYLIEFHATRDYFECHELLEEYWKEQPNDGHANLWVALIQLAVGQYHERRGNVRGAMKMYSACHIKFQQELEWTYGIHVPTLNKAVMERMLACQSKQVYEDICLVLEPLLEQFCIEQTKQRGLKWHKSSADVTEDIIHRHTQRDRSEVISARQEALRIRKQARKDG